MTELGILRSLIHKLIKLHLDREAFWKQHLKESRALLHVDELTGLFNYRYLKANLRKEINRSLRTKSPFAVLFVDIDDFKKINDTFGHLAGSSILKQLGTLLLSTVREHDSVIRYGGDEFVILLTDIDKNDSALVAQRIRSTVASFPFSTHGKQVHLSVSIGLASFPEHSAYANDLLSLADQAMYEGKRSGKNKVWIYAPKLVENRVRGARD